MHPTGVPTLKKDNILIGWKGLSLKITFLLPVVISYHINLLVTAPVQPTKSAWQAILLCTLRLGLEYTNHGTYCTTPIHTQRGTV